MAKPNLAFALDTSTPPTLSDEIYADLALRGYLDNISVSYYNPDNSESIAISDTKHWLPASTVKLFAAIYAFKKIGDHSLNLYDYVTADAKNVVPTESVQDGLPLIQAGDSVTVDRLIRQMITQSDNTAFNMLLDVLDRKEVTSYIQSLGLTHSAVGSKLNLDTTQTQYEFDVNGYGINTTTAQDYTKAFELILKNKIPGSPTLLSILKQQKINYMLPLLLPKNVVVAHKHGDLDPLYHDGGIVFTPGKNPYIISIFSNIGDPNVIAHLSQLIYTRDPKLVGSTLQGPPTTSQTDQPIDPLVAQGFLPNSNVLAAQTSILQTQPITASDLGITAKDLSLADTSMQLPKVSIPADSLWHFLISIGQTLKRASAFSIKDKTQVQTQSILLQVAEAKDLYKRNKTAGANSLIQNVQQEINTVAKTPVVKNNATVQIALQAVSETRFQVIGENLKNASSDSQRNEIIKQLGQQAKATLSEVQPNLPLASNATNVSQKPLIGDVVSKNNTTIVVQTAGGQQITVPTNSNVTVKTKEIPQPEITPIPSIAVTPTATSTAVALSSVQVGTTVALVGSSVGNVFTPTFVLTNVPKELAAPEPVTVVKVNPENKTMVISENGVPVQVNVSSKTIIRGTDTTIGFNAVKPGDIVVVHGEPLKPVAPTPTLSIAPSSSPTPTSPSQKTTPTGAGNNNGPKTSPTQTQNGQQPTASTTQPPTPSKTEPTTSTTTPKSTTNTTVTPTSSKTSAPTTTTLQKNISSAPTTGQKVQTQTSPPPVKVTAPVKTAPVVPQPKVIQSTSIQVVEQKQNAAPSKPAPAPAAPQKTQPKTPQPPPAAPATTTTINTKTGEKKK